MIKNITDISDKCVNYINKHGAVVAEKMDLPYFTVCVDKTLKVVNSKGKDVNDIDCIINTIYKDIWDFVDNNFELFGKVYKTFGKCKIGFFYMPVHKTNVIEYKNIEEGSFILGSFYCADKSKKDDDKLVKMFSDVAKRFPKICEVVSFPYYLDGEESSVELVDAFTHGWTYSGNDISDIEGIIVSSGNYKFQIIVNSAVPVIEKTTKKIYRDKLLCNFANVMFDRLKSGSVRMYGSYIENVSFVFLEYINSTDIFSTTFIEPDDLLPPKLGYFGNIDFDSLPPTVRLVCSSNEIYKNVFRILLVTFAYDVEKKIDDFPDMEKEKLLYISGEINNTKKRI